ncbi:MAG: HAD-IIB family hydrolase, partial [Proteobacteria bacterium]
MSAPVLFAKADLSRLKKIRGVCFDIDDTFSSHGKITAEAFEALWRLKNAGYVLVPVTGRPAGWCDHIARFWPVDAVVGENGAFIYYLDEEMRRRSILPPGTDVESAVKKSELIKKILARFPEAKFASDQL